MYLDSLVQIEYKRLIYKIVSFIKLYYLTTIGVNYLQKCFILYNFILTLFYIFYSRTDKNIIFETLQLVSKINIKKIFSNRFLYLDKLAQIEYNGLKINIYTSEDLNSHPKRGAIQTITGNLVEELSAVRISFFNGINIFVKIIIL